MSSPLSKKKILLFGFVVILLITIPVSVYIAQKRQETRTQAAQSTKLSFSPATLSVGVSETIKLDIILDPGAGPNANHVSFVKLTIGYDSSKLSIVDPPGLAPNTNPADNNKLTEILEGPSYPPGVASITLSVGADPTKAVKTITKIASISLKTLAATDTNNPTKIIFDSNTQVLSVAPADQASENVLLSAPPATVIIGGKAAPAGTATPTAAPTQTPAPQGLNKLPICTALTIDRQASGSAPYLIVFGASGNDPDGTIGKVTFNFGDTKVEDVTTGGGIGTNVANVQASHTYKNPGTFTASAVLTDNNGALSNVASCTQVITVAGLGGVPQPTEIAEQPIPTELAQQPPPILPPPGPTETIIGIGIIGAILSIIGGILFFTL